MPMTVIHHNMCAFLSLVCLNAAWLSSCAGRSGLHVGESGYRSDSEAGNTEEAYHALRSVRKRGERETGDMCRARFTAPPATLGSVGA